MRNIYIVDTPYHLLIAAIKTLVANREGLDSIIIMKKDIPTEIQNRTSLIYREVINTYNRYTIFANIVLLNIQKIELPLISKVIKKRTNKLLQIFSSNTETYIFDDTFYFGCWLNNAGIAYHLIEDAINYYKGPKKKRFRMKIYDCLYRVLGISWDYWGTSKLVKSIEVNENKDLRVSHNNIIEQNRETLFKQLTSKQIDIIASIFNYQPLRNVISGKKTLLLTQPLSEDNLISHTKKVKLYKHLVKKYGIGTIYIKVHPREREDYSKIFPEAIILGNPKIPFELYQLKEKLHFNRAVTAYSTAIHTITCADEIIKHSSEWAMSFDDQE